jgi:hypothetical protein
MNDVFGAQPACGMQERPRRGGDRNREAAAKSSQRKIWR